MSVAQKALWLIESRLGQTLTLEGLARELGVSAFHLSRAFSASHGIAPMRYVRRRRLREAARRLVDCDAGSVIDVALEAGYSSQEAFTRAFSAEFGRPPRTFRQLNQQGPIGGLEAILMENHSTLELEPPRIVALDALRLVGLARRYNEQTSAQIPDQWALFNDRTIARGADEAAYGVCYNADAEGNLDYLCGIAVADFDDSSTHRDRLTLPAQTYAVFAHSGHVSEIRQVWQAVWNQGLLAAGLTASEGPEFEKYGPSFDPVTGKGGFEIWVPVVDPG